MNKNIIRFINATLLMTAFVLAFSLAKPMLHTAFAQEAQPNCPSKDGEGIPCNSGAVGAQRAEDYFTQPFAACMTVGQGCCQYVMQGHYCIYYFADNHSSTRSSGQIGTNAGSGSDHVCGGDGVCSVRLHPNFPTRRVVLEKEVVEGPGGAVIP